VETVVGLPTRFLLGSRSVGKFLISYEVVSQLLSAANGRPDVEVKDAWERLQYGTRGVQTIDVDRYLGLDGELIYNSSAMVAYIVYRHFAGKVNRMGIVPVPDEPAA